MSKSLLVHCQTGGSDIEDKKAMGQVMTSLLEEENAPHNVIVLEFLQQTDLADGGAGDTLVFCLEANLLEGHNLICCHIPGLVDNAIRP